MALENGWLEDDPFLFAEGLIFSGLLRVDVIQTLQVDRVLKRSISELTGRRFWASWPETQVLGICVFAQPWESVCLVDGQHLAKEFLVKIYL